MSKTSWRFLLKQSWICHMSLNTCIPKIGTNSNHLSYFDTSKASSKETLSRWFTAPRKKFQKQPLKFNKKMLQHRYFSVSFTKFLGTHFLLNTSGQLLLDIKIGKLRFTAFPAFAFDATLNSAYVSVKYIFYWLP